MTDLNCFKTDLTLMLNLIRTVYYVMRSLRAVFISGFPNSILHEFDSSAFRKAPPEHLY